jgi:hypothetical protein
MNLDSEPDDTFSQRTMFQHIPSPCVSVVHRVLRGEP